jgi:hypothetical protein
VITTSGPKLRRFARFAPRKQHVSIIMLCFASSRIYLCADNIFAHVTLQKGGSDCKSAQIWGSLQAFQAAKKIDVVL